MWLYLALFALASVVLLLKRVQKPARFPPGPPRLPFLGSLPFLSDSKPGNPALRVGAKMAQEYGRFWGCYIGNTPMVTISDFKVAKRLLSLDATSDRQHFLHRLPAAVPFLSKCLSQAQSEHPINTIQARIRYMR